MGKFIKPTTNTFQDKNNYKDYSVHRTLKFIEPKVVGFVEIWGFTGDQPLTFYPHQARRLAELLNLYADGAEELSRDA